MVREFYAIQDRILGRLLEETEGAIVMVVSDHGFRSGQTRLPESDSIEVPNAHLWHTRLGVFIAKGPGIRQGVTIPEASVFDIAPTILALLDLPIADNMPGTVLVDILESSAQKRVSRIPTYEIGDSSAKVEEAMAKTDVDELVKERLEALGYISKSGTSSRGTHMNNALALMEKGEWRRAEEELELARRQSPADGRICFELGKAQLQQGILENAIQSLTQATRYLF